MTSFLRGLGSLLNLWPARRTAPVTETLSDAQRADLERIAADMQRTWESIIDADAADALERNP